MSDTALRASLIRLAYQNPSLRADILPLVTKEAGSYRDYVEKKRKKGEKPLAEDAWKARTQGGGKAEEKGGKGGGKAEAKGGKGKGYTSEHANKITSQIEKKVGDDLFSGHGDTSDNAQRIMDDVWDAAKKTVANEGFSQEDSDEMWADAWDSAKSAIEEAFDNAIDSANDNDDESLADEYESQKEKWLKNLGSRPGKGPEAEGKPAKKPGQPPAEGKKKPSFKKNYRPKMESVMKKHELTDDDAAQVIQFSIDRPKKGKPQSPEELMRRFMQNAKPETKERMKGMTPAEFMVMLRAVLDEEEGGGKAASLRTAAIRFAYENPLVRKHVLAAIKEADAGSPGVDKAELAKDADPKSKDQNLASTWEKVGPSAE